MADDSFNNPHGWQTFNWHLEISSKCRLACPRCPRTEKRGKYKVTELSLGFVQKNFPPKFLQNNVERILLCGGQGDPIYNSQFLDIVRYLKESHPDLWLVVITNGSHKTLEFWQQFSNLVTSKDEIIFSLDGWDNTSNEIYRKHSNFDSAIEGLRLMANSAAKVAWSTIVFRHNENRIADMLALARKNGADYFDVTFSNLFGSIDSSYINNDLGFDPYEPTSNFYKSNIGRHQKISVRLNPNLPERSPSPRMIRQMNIVNQEYQDSTILPLCKGSHRALYVDAEGILYPCSWVSHPFGIRRSKNNPIKEIRWEESLWNEHRSVFDLKSRSIPAVLADPIWQRLIKGWRNQDSCFVECETKCGNQKVEPNILFRQPVQSLNTADFIASMNETI